LAFLLKSLRHSEGSDRTRASVVLPLLRQPGKRSDLAVIYKGVEYIVVATAETDIWEWRFEFGNKGRTGRTKTRLAAPGARRVRGKIDANLRAAKLAIPSQKS